MRTHVSGKRAKESACSRLNERQARGMGGITLAALIAPTLHIPASIQDDSADHAFPTYRARYATGLPDRLPHAQDHQAHRHWGHHPRWDGTQTLSGYFSSFFPFVTRRAPAGPHFSTASIFCHSAFTSSATTCSCVLPYRLASHLSQMEVLVSRCRFLRTRPEPGRLPPQAGLRSINDLPHFCGAWRGDT